MTLEPEEIKNYRLTPGELRNIRNSVEISECNNLMQCMVFADEVARRVSDAQISKLLSSAPEEQCLDCEGRGYTISHHSIYSMSAGEEEHHFCWKCKGTGKIPKLPSVAAPEEMEKEIYKIELLRSDINGFDEHGHKEHTHLTKYGIDKLLILFQSYTLAREDKARKEERERIITYLKEHNAYKYVPEKQSLQLTPQDWQALKGE